MKGMLFLARHVYFKRVFVIVDNHSMHWNSRTFSIGFFKQNREKFEIVKGI